MKECQILGLQRSGTNYLQDLITDNFSNVSVFGNSNSDCIWKHSITPNFTQYPDCLIYIYKHPLTWIESAIRTKVDNFIDKLEITNEGPKVNNIPIKSLVNLYNKSLQTWIVDYKLNIPIVYVQYEKLLDKKEIESFFQVLTNKFSFKRDTDKVHIRKLGDTYCSDHSYQSNHLDNYKNIVCKMLTKNEQDYIINNINKDIVTLLYRYDT